MSWEGYDQLICEKGHYWTADLSGLENCICSCPICGSDPVWFNAVDFTNGSYFEGKRIDGYIEMKIKKEIKCSCGECVKEVLYEIPKRGKLKSKGLIEQVKFT